MADVPITLRSTADVSGIQRAISAYSQLSTAEQAAARDALSAAQSAARLEQALGQPAAAAQRLHTALQSATALDTAQAAQALNQIARLEAQATQEAQKLAAAQAQATKAPPVAAPAADTRAAEQAAIRYASSLTQAQRAQGDLTGAAQTWRSVLSQLTPNTIEYNQVLARTAQIEVQAARGADQAAAAERRKALGLGTRGGFQILPRTVEEFGTKALDQARASILGLIGPAALATAAVGGIAVAIRGVGSAVSAANSLERTETTVRALSGSTARYAQVLVTAQAGQQAYGGSLETSLRGLGSLVNLSNRAEVELGKLDNISRRLAIVDPVQGIEGANIALKEFLTGTGSEAALSLARRFELPKKALEDLAKEGTTAQQRLAGLDRLLNQQGITTQVLTDRTKTQAAIYDRLGAAASNAQVSIGGLLSTLLSYPAQVTTTVLINVSGGINVLANADEQIKKFSTQAFAGAKSLDDYRARVAAADVQLAPFGVHLSELAAPAYEYARALQQQGASAQDAFAKAQQYGDTVNQVTTLQTRAGISSGDWSNALGGVAQRAAETAAASDYSRQQVEGLVAAYQNGSISAPAFAAAIDEVARRNDAAAQAAFNEEREQRRLSGAYGTTRAAIAQAQSEIGTFINSLQSSADASTLDAAKKELQSASTKLLGDQTSATVNAFLDLNPNMTASSAIAAAAAAGYSPLIGKLAALQIELQGATREQILFNNVQNQKAVNLAVRSGEAAGGREREQAERSQALVGVFRNQNTEQQKLIDSESALAAARGQTNKQVQLLQQKKADLRFQDLSPAERQAAINQIDAQIISIQDSAAKKTKKGTAVKGISADLNLAQAGLEGADRLQARLDAVNQKLETAKLSEQQRKQLTAEKLDLETKIGDALDKQRRFAVDARLAQVDDERKRLDETIRQNQARQVLESGAASEDQKARARLALQEVPLEQQKRALDIARLNRESGGAIPGAAGLPTGITPLGGPAPAAGAVPQAAQQQGGAGQQVGIFMDGKQVGTVLLPYLIAALRSGRAQVQATGG